MSISMPDMGEVMKDVPQGYGVMALMDKTGDTRHLWDPSNTADIAQAERTFNDYKSKGYAAYRVNPKTGEKGEVINKFDAQAAAIIFVPPLVGG